MSTSELRSEAVPSRVVGPVPATTVGLVVFAVGSGAVALSSAGRSTALMSAGAAALPSPSLLHRLLVAADELLVVACLATIAAAVMHAAVSAVGRSFARHLVSGGVAVSLVVALLGLAAVPVVDAAASARVLLRLGMAPVNVSVAMDPWLVRAAVLVALAAVMTDPPHVAGRERSAAILGAHAA